MLFAIISTDVPDSLSLRMPVRDQHIARLKDLDSQDRLTLAGPHPATDEAQPEKPAFTGSLVVAEFDDLEAAKTWADADPYLLSGVYEKVTVKPYKKVFPS